MGELKDIRGQRFGRLTVLDRAERNDGHTSWWICKCDCGTIKEIRRSCLIKGSTKSCGCYNHDQSREHGRKMMTKHGWYGTRVYNSWHRMVERCENPNNPQYKNYGERGIKVCEEWRNHPERFCEWAMANGYADGLSIDRIDVNGDYEPNNCRWITMKEQQTNKRNNVLITYNGKTQCIAEWSRELGVSYHIIHQRLHAGWANPQEILFGKQKGVKKNV